MMPLRAGLRPFAVSTLLRPPIASATRTAAARNAIPSLAAAATVPSCTSHPSQSFSSGTQSPAEERTPPADPPPPPPSRWYGDLHARLGKCLMFGCNATQIKTASTILAALTTEWRQLLAGSQGFLTTGGPRAGLQNQQVVWGEQDSFSHVNNVTYVRYAESSRVNWVMNFAHHIDPANREAWEELMTPRSIGLILKNIQVDYKFPVTYPDKVSVYHKLTEHPESARSPTSLRLEAVILSHKHRRVAASVLEDVVVYDYRAGKKTPAPPFTRKVLGATYDLQVQEQHRARSRIWGLIADVTKLEQETWDRPDAQEDVGTPITS